MASPRLQRKYALDAKEVNALLEISKAIASGLYLEDVLRLIVTVTANVMDSKICSLWMLDEKDQKLKLKATQSISEAYLKERSLGMGEGVVGAVALYSHAMAILDVLKDPLYKEKDLARREGLVSMLSVPMCIKNRVIGVINCYTSYPHSFSKIEEEMLTTVANQAAICIENSGLMETIRVDVRFIVATNKNLEEAISTNRFREDLYYRLNVVSIKIPPLRERREDIPELVSYFLKKFNREMKKGIAGISPSAMEKMAAYPWPGNVRQLENVLKRAMVLCQGEWILEDQLVLEKGGEKGEVEEDLGGKPVETLLDLLFEEFARTPPGEREFDMISLLEKGLILRALQKTRGNQVQAAQLLGINRNTLRGKIERYHIKREVRVSEEES